jgi:hypothetical protein
MSLVQKVGSISSFDNDEHILLSILREPKRWQGIYIGIHQQKTSGAGNRITGKIKDICEQNGIRRKELPHIGFYDSSLIESIF